MLWAKAGRTIDHAMMGDEVLSDCPQSARRASQFGVIICREEMEGSMSRGFPTPQPATRQAVRLEAWETGGLYACTVARYFLLRSSKGLRPRQELKAGTHEGLEDTVAGARFGEQLACEGTDQVTHQVQDGECPF